MTQAQHTTTSESRDETPERSRPAVLLIRPPRSLLYTVRSRDGKTSQQVRLQCALEIYIKARARVRGGRGHLSERPGWPSGSPISRGSTVSMIAFGGRRGPHRSGSRCRGRPIERREAGREGCLWPNAASQGRPPDGSGGESERSTQNGRAKTLCGGGGGGGAHTNSELPQAGFPESGEVLFRSCRGGLPLPGVSRGSLGPWFRRLRRRQRSRQGRRHAGADAPCWFLTYYLLTYLLLLGRLPLIGGSIRRTTGRRYTYG